MLNTGLSAVYAAIAMAYVWRVHQRDPAVRYWASGFLGIAAGALLVGLRAQLPAVWSVVAANTLIVFGTSLMYLGTALFTRRPARWRVVAALCAATALAMIYWGVIRPDFAWRVAALSLGMWWWFVPPGLLIALCYIVFSAAVMGVLGYFKYANFFVTNLEAVTGADWSDVPYFGRRPASIADVNIDSLTIAVQRSATRSFVGKNQFPSWSPDGQTLAFVRAEPNRPKVWNLWTADLETGKSANFYRAVGRVGGVRRWHAGRVRGHQRLRVVDQRERVRLDLARLQRPGRVRRVDRRRAELAPGAAAGKSTMDRSMNAG